MENKITYNDIVQLNSALYENEIYYKLQYENENTATIWSLGACACSGKRGYFHEFVEKYFSEKGLRVDWSQDCLSFTVKEKL